MNGNVVEAQEETNNLLLTKVGDALNIIKESYVPYVYSQSLGIAGISEARKKAKVTDKEDDGEGMDPVGKADSDVDNDGDSDDSDEYIKNRRKAIGKAIDKEDEEDDDDDEDVKEEVEISERGDPRQSHIYGVERSKYAAMTDDQKDQVKAKYYREAETAQRERS